MKGDRTEALLVAALLLCAIVQTILALGLLLRVA